MTLRLQDPFQWCEKVVGGGYREERNISLLFFLINYSICILKVMKFIVYSKDDCPYCYKVKQVLELTGNNFMVYNLGEDFTREEFIQKFGEGSTFPQVLFNDERIGGCVDTIKFLKEKQIVK